MPHYITIPASDITDGPDGKPVETTFVQILKDRWLNDSRFGVNLAAMRAGNHLESLFENASVGEEICIQDDNAWSILSQAADAPKTVLINGNVVEGYAPQLRKRALRLAEAVTNAPTTPQALSKKEASNGAEHADSELVRKTGARRAGSSVA